MPESPLLADLDTPLTVEDLLLQAEIARVFHRYVRGIDRVDYDLVASCYTPDGYDDHNQFRGSAKDFVEWLRPRLGRHASTTHFPAQPAVRRISATVAQSETYCVIHQISPLDAAGQRTAIIEGIRYLDRFEQVDGRWLIAHRRATVDWRYYVDADAKGGPPFDPTWTVGRRDRDDPSYIDA
jgi:hypothetical protein